MNTVSVLVELYDDSSVQVEVGEEYNVRDIKTEIAKVTGIETCDQNLVFEGAELSDDQEVMDLGLGFDAVLTLEVTNKQKATEEIEGHGWEVGPDAMIDAALRGDAFAVTLQLEAGVDVNSKQSGRYNQYTALHAVSRCGSEKVAQILFDFTADPNVCDYFGEVPLHDVARSGEHHITAMLLSRGANPNAANHYSRTPLMEAVARNNVAVASALLEHGCDLSLTDDRGCKASDLATTKDMFKLFPNKL
eukprot:TRINITY_DN769_c0_g1_i1.p1 TRINITY_DN769_c0_g1~~TRINITY_DN769_c0_g1_i1.p1  ORF type:complete len:248 (+),score=42.59 TRINITY_DN769_c0_g1_i1:90-833(+)